MHDLPSKPAAPRRLAAIVAIDVAGYSARAEADETAAAAAIAALSDRIDAACTANGGRVFNTAGDGFMLEFPTVSGALEAADAIAADTALPVRVGVHLGEVMVTPTGDLLGHGVNVAARLQALAPPHGVFVSADVQRALRGPLAERLADRGLMRLDKMDETVRVYALADTRRPRPRLRRASLPLILGAALLFLALAAGAVWLLRDRLWPAPDPDISVAVAPFKVFGGDPATHAMADGMADEITSALSDSQMLTISADGGSGAAPAIPRATFVLEGSVERDAANLTVRVRLINPASQVTLWSENFSGQAAAPAGLQTQVAAKATDIVSYAIEARRRRGGPQLDDAALADYIHGAEAQIFSLNSVAARPIIQRLVARAPEFGRGYALLAMVDGAYRRYVTPDQAAALQAEARYAADRAVALDPGDGLAYYARSRLYPRADRANRVRLVEKGLAAEPQNPYLNNQYGYLLAELGRSRDSVTTIRKGLSLNPLHPGANYRLATMLAQVGRYPEARPVLDELVRKWPVPWTREARLAVAMTYGPLDDARAVLRDAQADAVLGQKGFIPLWTAFLQAREGRDPAVRARAIQLIKASAALPDETGLRHVEAIQALTVLGDLDGAYAEIDADITHDVDLTSYALYSPATAPLRADPRFWPMTVRWGLARQWRDSGRWPDFCAEPGADCKVKAAEALGGK